MTKENVVAVSINDTSADIFAVFVFYDSLTITYTRYDNIILRINF